MINEAEKNVMRRVRVALALALARLGLVAACDVGDGYHPNSVGTTTSNPQALGAGAITNHDALWPNGTSETNPPPNIVVANDGSQPEWDYRSNVGAGAFDGSWVRALVGTTLSYTIPVVRDEIIQFVVWGKNIAGAASSNSLTWYDSNGTVLQTSTGSNFFDAAYDWFVPVGGGAWGWGFVAGRNPAGAVKVKATLNPNGGTSNYDSISLRRLPPPGPVGGSYFETGSLLVIDCITADTFTSIVNVVAGGGIFLGVAQHAYIGQRFTIKCKNAAAAGGNQVWNFPALYKMTAPPSITVGNGFSISIDFVFDGTNFFEVSRSGTIPN